MRPEIKLNETENVGFFVNRRNVVSFLGFVTLFILALFHFVSSASGQKKRPNASTPNELARLRDEFVKASDEYKASLQKLLVFREADVRKSKAHFEQSKELYDGGLIAKNQLLESESALAEAQARVLEIRQQMTNADTQVANILLESRTETELAKGRLPRGSLIKTTSYIRYQGASGWSLSEAHKIQNFFYSSFRTPLPIAVFGQGTIHDRWRLDHRNAMDISLHPDSAEGQALINFLRAHGIPFLAFRTAIPGTSTGPHIHIGRPSHRF